MIQGDSSAIPVLDKGFMQVVDWMGTDSSIVQAARVSYGKGTKSSREDSKLIKYLMKNGHMSPFEMCSIKLRIKLPIFVMRQLVRYRTAKINEYSCRYSEAITDYYLPDIERFRKQSSVNKQGSGELLDSVKAEEFRLRMDGLSKAALASYEQMLSGGLSRELARVVLPVNFYTMIYWKMDLRNIFNVLKQRLDAHAQWEIREYARVLSDIVRDWCPLAYEAFENIVLGEVYSCQLDQSCRQAI